MLFSSINLSFVLCKTKQKTIFTLILWLSKKIYRIVKLQPTNQNPQTKGGRASYLHIGYNIKTKPMSVVFLVRPTLLSRVLVNDIQAIFFILLVLFSFSFLAKKKKKMNKLKARFIAKEGLEVLAIDKFFVTNSLIAGFYLYFYKNYV